MEGLKNLLKVLDLLRLNGTLSYHDTKSKLQSCRVGMGFYFDNVNHTCIKVLLCRSLKNNSILENVSYILLHDKSKDYLHVKW